MALAVPSDLLMVAAVGRGVPSIPGIAAPVIDPDHALDKGTGSNPVRGRC